MIIALVAIIGGIITLCVVSYTYQRNQSLDAMRNVLDNVTDLSINVVSNKFYEGTSGRDSGYDGVIFTVVTDANGNILSAGCNQSEITVSSDMLQSATQYAVGSRKDSGNVSGYSLRFLKRSFKGGYKIALADRSQEISNFYFQLRMYLFGAIFMLAVALLVIWYMAEKAIAPVDQSIQDQKRFIADASHELKTPLTVILANTDILAGDLGAPIGSKKKWLDSTKTEANRMTELVNEMLFLARADAGIQPSFHYERISLTEIMDDCVLTCESLAFENQVHLKAKIMDNVRIVGDEGKLKQVLMILIENAMKYVNRGGTIEVKLSTLPLSKMAKVSVTNTGDPIPPMKVDHLFDRFYRADEARTREKGGYGLGLAIAQNITKQHNGEVELEFSDAEQGTRFTMKVPLETNSHSRKVGEQEETGGSKPSRSLERAHRRTERRTKQEMHRRANRSAKRRKRRGEIQLVEELPAEALAEEPAETTEKPEPVPESAPENEDGIQIDWDKPIG